MSISQAPTPYERLLAEKLCVKNQSLEQQQKLNDNFAYMQAHAGRLLLSGMFFLMQPKRGEKKNVSPSLKLTDYMSIAQGMLPAVWKSMKPLLVTWGLKKISSVFIRLLSGGNKIRPNN